MGAAAQTLVVTPNELSLAIPSGSATLATGTLTVSSSAGRIPFTAATRHLGSVDPWLTVGATSGFTPANLTVTANASKLPPGTYLAQVTVAAGGVGAVVNVILAVGGAGTAGGNLIVSPSGLTFIGLPGVPDLPSQTITVTAGPGTFEPVSFRVVASSSGWLSVPAGAATTPANLQVTVSPGGLPAGTFTGSVTLLPLTGGTPTVVPVTLISAGTTNPDPALRLTQSAITISHQIGSSSPPYQTVGVLTSGGSRLYSANTNASWIRLTTAFSSTPSISLLDIAPSELRVGVEPAGLVPGTYVGTVNVSSTGLPTIALPVSLVVTSNPAFNAQPSSILLDSVTQTVASIELTSTGGSALPFTASATSLGEWLSVTPATGFTGGSGAQVLTVRANTPGLAVGIHNGTISIASPNSPTLTIPVRITVAPGAATGALAFFPEEVSLTALAGSTTNPSRVVQIITEGGAPHNFNVAASSSTGWLIAEPFTGTAPAALTIRANLAAVRGIGIHSGSVTVTSLITGQQYSIPVTLEVLEDAIVADPGSLTFVQAQYGAGFTPQTLQIRANSPSTFRIQAPDWIKLDISSGVTPSVVTIWPDLALLPPGTNAATIRIIGPKNQLNIPVTVGLAELPKLTGPAGINFTYALGNPTAPSQAIRIDSPIGTPEINVSVSTTSGVNWLSVSPSSGRVPAILTVTVDPDVVVPGREEGTITITSKDGSAQRLVIPVSLTVSSPSASLQSILHSATLLPTKVAPGQIVTLTGAGLGPRVGAAARPSAAGAYETRFADTRVLFDGIPAPLLYVSGNQINAIVPYAIAGRATTKVQVEQLSSWSVPIELRVEESNPGLFTANGSGRGQAAALNGDLTLNSAANPAVRGSVITVFGTGEGQTNSAGQDGRIIGTDLKTPVLPVTARIGGRPAEVQYAGSAPQQVSGVFQVNLWVPADVEPGTAAVELQVGNAVSQAGVTIAVR